MSVHQDFGVTSKSRFGGNELHGRLFRCAHFLSRHGGMSKQGGLATHPTKKFLFTSKSRFGGNNCCVPHFHA
jgi:hypothetical protein